jgi:hypothetical protein
MRKNWKTPPRTGEASAPDGMTVEMNGFRPEPSVFNDAKVAAEAAPTKDGFCRRIFRPEPSAFDDARVTTDTTPTTPNPWLSMTQWSRLKPLLQKDGFCRRGFSPEPVFEATKGPGEGRPCNPEPPSSMTQGRGESRSYQKTIFVGGALAPNLSSRPQRVLVKAVPATLNLRLR